MPGTWSVTVFFKWTGIRASLFIKLMSVWCCKVGRSQQHRNDNSVTFPELEFTVKSNSCPAVKLEVPQTLFKPSYELAVLCFLQDLSPSCVRSATLQPLSWEMQGTT